MTKDQFVNVLTSLPEVRKMELNQADKEELCLNYLDVIMDKVLTAYQWDFSLNVYDVSISASEPDYTIVGSDNDCWRIHSIRIGSGTPDDGYNMLEQLTPEQSDKWLDNRNTYGVKYWYPNGYVQGHPVIKIVDTPTDATKTLRCRYWSTNIDFNNFPYGFSLVFLMGVKYLLGAKSEQAFLRAIRGVINDYSRSGGDSDPVGGDPKVITRNNERAGLYYPIAGKYVED